MSSVSTQISSGNIHKMKVFALLFFVGKLVVGLASLKNKLSNDLFLQDAPSPANPNGVGKLANNMSLSTAVAC